MTFFDRFMLSFIFGYIVASALMRIFNDIKMREIKKDIEHEAKNGGIKFVGSKKLSEKETDEFLKAIGIIPEEEDDEEE